MLISDKVVVLSSQESWNYNKWAVHSNKEDLYADYEDWGKTVQKILGLMGNTDIWALLTIHQPRPTAKAKSASWVMQGMPCAQDRRGNGFSPIAETVI